MCIEMMFPYDVFPKEHLEFVFMMGGKKLAKAKGEMWVAKLTESPDLFDDVPFRVVPKFKDKTALASSLASLDETAFTKFKPVFGLIKRLLQQMS